MSTRGAGVNRVFFLPSFSLLAPHLDPTVYSKEEINARISIHLNREVPEDQNNFSMWLTSSTELLYSHLDIEGLGKVSIVPCFEDTKDDYTDKESGLHYRKWALRPIAPRDERGSMRPTRYFMSSNSVPLCIDMANILPLLAPGQELQLVSTRDADNNECINTHRDYYFFC